MRLANVEFNPQNRHLKKRRKGQSLTAPIFDPSSGEAEPREAETGGWVSRSVSLVYLASSRPLRDPDRFQHFGNSGPMLY